MEGVLITAVFAKGEELLSSVNTSVNLEVIQVLPDGGDGKGRPRLERNLKLCARNGPSRPKTAQAFVRISQQNRRSRRGSTYPAAVLSHGTGVRIPVPVPLN